MVIIGSFCLINYSYAQSKYMNLKFGGNISSFSGGSEFTTPKLGPYLGIASYIEINENFHFLPQLVLSNQGWTTKDRGYSLSCWYINMPLVLQNISTSGFVLSYGAQFGTLILANSKYGSYKESEMTRMNNFDVSLVMGVGYKLNDRFIIETHYNFGLTKAFSDHSNRVFQIGVSYVLEK